MSESPPEDTPEVQKTAIAACHKAFPEGFTIIPVKGPILSALLGPHYENLIAARVMMHFQAMFMQSFEEQERMIDEQSKRRIVVPDLKLPKGFDPKGGKRG